MCAMKPGKVVVQAERFSWLEYWQGIEKETAPNTKGIKGATKWSEAV